MLPLHVIRIQSYYQIRIGSMRIEKVTLILNLHQCASEFDFASTRV